MSKFLIFSGAYLTLGRSGCPKITGKGFRGDRDAPANNRETVAHLSQYLRGKYRSDVIAIPARYRASATSLRASCVSRARNRGCLPAPGKWNVRAQKMGEAQTSRLFSPDDRSCQIRAQEGEVESQADVASVQL